MTAGKTSNKQICESVIVQNNSLVDDVLNDFNEDFSTLLKEEQNTKKDTSQQKTVVPEKKPSTVADLQNAQKKFIEQKKDSDEKTIVGLDLVESYAQWIQSAKNALDKATSQEVKEQIFKYVPKRFFSKENTKTFQQPAVIKSFVKTPKNLPFIQKRLDHIEERIKKLDETKPEYIEERVLLENKKSSIEHEGEKELSYTDTSKTTTLETKSKDSDEQIKTVEDLLKKKTFDSIAPVVSPIKEEQKRIHHAHLSAKIDDTPIHHSGKTKTHEKQKVEKISTDKQLQEASWMRESFIQNLHYNKNTWYENPSKNRDHVNEQIFKIAELLSGKESFTIDMDDIQTARLFVFNNAPKEILEHPAFSYVESFYNYQTKQGYAGKTTKEFGKAKPIKSPYATNKTTVGR